MKVTVEAHKNIDYWKKLFSMFYHKKIVGKVLFRHFFTCVLLLLLFLKVKMKMKEGNECKDF